MPGIKVSLPNDRCALALGDVADGVIEIRENKDPKKATESKIIRIIDNKDHVSEILALSNDEILVSSSSKAAPFRVFNITTGALVKDFSQENEGVDSMILSKDAKEMIAGSGYPEEHIRIFNLEKGTLTRKLPQHGSGVSAIMLYDNDCIAAGSSSRRGTTRIISLVDGTLLRIFPQTTGITSPDQLKQHLDKQLSKEAVPAGVAKMLEKSRSSFASTATSTPASQTAEVRPAYRPN